MRLSEHQNSIFIIVRLNTEYENTSHKGMNDFDRVYGTFINDIKVLYRTGAPWWGIIHFGRLRILERSYCHVISHHVMYLES